MTVTVLIADDHALTLRGMHEALETIPGLKVIGTVLDGVSAIAEAKRLKPDLILMDISMPGVSGVDAFVEIRRWSPDTRVAIITGNPTPGIFSELASSGIDGLFVKSGPIEELCDGVRRLAAGERVFSDQAQDLIDASGDAAQLSGRELQVLQAVVDGLTNSGIADRLMISPKTVDKHRTSLMRKLGVRSTASLIVCAARDGLVEL